LPTCCDATQAAARRHDFDIGVEQLFGRLEIMRHDCLDELTYARELHRRKLASADTIFKNASTGLFSQHDEPPLWRA
jgi:hypothetical protein